MRRSITALFAVAAMYLTACSKNNPIPAVNGTINGISAVTLYGSSGKPTDYVLLSTNASYKEMSYDGQTYSYYDIASANDIFIMVSPTDPVRGTLTTTGSQTVLTVVNTAPVTFASTQYASR